MFVDDGYSSNEESAAEEQSKKERKQSKLKELNRRRHHTLDNSNKLKDTDVKSSKALNIHERGLIFSKQDKEDEFLEDIEETTNKKRTSSGDDLPLFDSELRYNPCIKEHDPSENSVQEITITVQEAKKEDLRFKVSPHESKSYTSKPSRAVREEEIYWTEELDNMWTETSLLLRVPITNAEDLIFVEASAEAGLLFMSELDDVARSLNVMRGTLSRWLLPYDQNTRLDEQSSTPHRYLFSCKVHSPGFRQSMLL